MKINKNLFIIMLGFAVMIIPVLATSLVTIPQSPYILDNYYSHGIIDYKSAATNQYYLAIVPLTTTATTIDEATMEFVEAGVTLDFYLKDVMDVEIYDQYLYRYDTTVVSDGLQFNFNYTINAFVEDGFGNSHQVTNWLMFVPDGEPVDDDELPGDDTGSDFVLPVQFLGSGIAVFGGLNYVREKKKK